MISLKGAYNEEGKQMLRTKGANEWDPWSLVDLKDDKNETRIIGTRSVRKICRLRDGIYRVEIHPSPGNVNILGSCGGEMSAGVVVEKAAATVVRTDFEGDCHGEDPVIVEVEVRAGSRSPRIRRVPKAEFYK